MILSHSRKRMLRECFGAESPALSLSFPLPFFLLPPSPVTLSFRVFQCVCAVRLWIAA